MELVSKETKSLRRTPPAQLEVLFRRFVGEQVGLPELASTPDFRTPDGAVNSEWISYIQGRNSRNRMRLGKSPLKNVLVKPPEAKRDTAITAGRLRFNPSTHEWSAVDPSTPIGEIASLRQRVKEVFAGYPSEQITAFHERNMRGRLSEIFNAFAGKSYNGVENAVNMNNFRGITGQLFVDRSLREWRRALVRTRQRSEEPALFNRWEDAIDKRMMTPSNADRFLYNALMAPREGNTDFSSAHQELDRLFAMGVVGYVRIADLFYGGSMEKAYRNISILAKKTGNPLPNGWRYFSDDTIMFREIESRWEELKPGKDGYMEVANKRFNGDMNAAYNKISAVANMTGRKFPAGWQLFIGSTARFKMFESILQNLEPGISSYLDASDTLFKGNMHKTFVNFSAVAKMTGLSFPAGWQQFPGNTTEFREIESRWEELKPGIGGLMEEADNRFNGHMVRAYKAFSAVAEMTGHQLPADWQVYWGSTTDLKKQHSWVSENPHASITDFRKRFKLPHKTAQACFNVVRIYNGEQTSPDESF